MDDINGGGRVENIGPLFMSCMENFESMKTDYKSGNNQ